MIYLHGCLHFTYLPFFLVIYPYDPPLLSNFTCLFVWKRKDSFVVKAVVWVLGDMISVPSSTTDLLCDFSESHLGSDSQFL